MPLTNDQISEQAKIAQESKYAGLWSQFQTFYADNANKAYGQEYFLERQNYGQIKAYMERRNFEQNLYSLNATYEEVAILRAMDQNYDLIAANPGIARTPEFVNQAIGEYVTDETAFTHYMSNYNQAAQENNYGLLKKLEALNKHLDTEEKIEDYYNQLGDAGKKQLALADINDMDEWKEAFDYFAAKSADEERKSNSN